MGRELHRIITPERFYEAHKMGFAHFQKSGKGAAIGQTLELPAIRKDGSEFPIDLSLAAIHLDNGWGAVGLARDITDRKNAEIELKASEEKYRNLMENISVGVTMINPAMEIVTMNKQMKEWNPNVTLSEIPVCYKSFNQPPREDICPYCPTVKTLKDGEIHKSVTSTPTPNGIMNFKVVSSPIKNNEGAVVAVIEFVEDITSEYRAEEMKNHLASIVENTDEAIIGETVDGTIISWNSGAKKLYGYTEEEVKGENISIIVPDAQKTKIEEIINNTKNGVKVERHETQRKTKEGDIVDVLLTVSPIKDTEGAIIGASSISHDISEKKKLERMKDEFISTVSHELRTPLTSLRGSLGLLVGGVMGVMEPEIQGLLEIAHNNTDRLVRLITDMLDLQKIESGRIQMRFGNTDLGELVFKSVEEMSAFANDNNVKIVSDIPKLSVVADPDRTIQVLDNLISNAVKFSPIDSEVHIYAEHLNGSVTLCVKDSGPGIPAEFEQRIFQKFQQADSSLTKQKGGTGLGLAICKAIVEGHGGKIWYESASGSGTTFKFTLETVKTTASSNECAASERGTFAKEKRLLLINDNEEFLHLLKSVLSRSGYLIDIANDALSAMKLAEENKPDTIILDVELPDRSGFDMLMQLKENENFRDVPVIILSAKGPKDYKHVLMPPVLDWLYKPVDMDRLFRALENSAGTDKTPTLLVIDDDIDLQKFLKVAFESKGICVKTASSGREGIEILKSVRPDLIILDIMMPNGDGFFVAGAMREKPELFQIPVVIYSAKELSAAEKEKLSLFKTEFYTKLKIPEDIFTNQIHQMVKSLVDYKNKTSLAR
ncbi:MAG: PAS domain S-box protein, partial [bacterium]